MDDTGFLAPVEWTARMITMMWEARLPRCSFCGKRDAAADVVIVFRQNWYGPAHRRCAEAHPVR